MKNLTGPQNKGLLWEHRECLCQFHWPFSWHQHLCIQKQSQQVQRVLPWKFWHLLKLFQQLWARVNIFNKKTILYCIYLQNRFQWIKLIVLLQIHQTRNYRLLRLQFSSYINNQYLIWNLWSLAFILYPGEVTEDISLASGGRQTDLW